MIDGDGSDPRHQGEPGLAVRVEVAARAGFDRAFSSIFDGQVTTLIVGVVLYQFGTGPIKGFAVIQCKTRLDVVAVYTAGGLDNAALVQTMHMERVAGTLIKGVVRG